MERSARRPAGARSPFRRPVNAWLSQPSNSRCTSSAVAVAHSATQSSCPRSPDAQHFAGRRRQRHFDAAARSSTREPAPARSARSLRQQLQIRSVPSASSFITRGRLIMPDPARGPHRGLGAPLRNPSPQNPAALRIELRLRRIERVEVQHAGLLRREPHRRLIQHARLPEDLAQRRVDQHMAAIAARKNSGHSHISPSSHGLAVGLPFHSPLGQRDADTPSSSDPSTDTAARNRPPSPRPSPPSCSTSRPASTPTDRESP